MKKIMFNDKYGLTEAVLQGKKTQTRRFIPSTKIEKYEDYLYTTGNIILPVDSRRMSLTEYCMDVSRYKVDEVIAIAQSYRHL